MTQHVNMGSTQVSSATISEWLAVRLPGVPDGSFALREPLVRIGRSSGNHVVVPDRYVSASHAEIVQQAGRRYVRDLGSTNGTQLNGSLLAPNTLVPLKDGDELSVGPSVLTYRAGGPGERGAGFSHEPPNRAPVAAAAPTRRRGLAGVPRFLLLLTAALVLLAAAAWAAAPPRVSLLVLGSDARPDELERGQLGRTDTVLLVVADRPPSGAAIVSLPRDLWVDIPGFGQERINAAYELAGAEGAKQTVGELLGVPVERYLVIGMSGVREVVDAAGGVEIYVDAAIHDPFYPTDDYGTIAIDIPSGPQHMDGETALRYARTRYQDSDFGRVARQQQLLVALRNKLLHPANWWRLPAVIAAVDRTTETDLGPLEVVALGLSLVGSPGEPERLVVGPGLVEEFVGGDGAYLLRPRSPLPQQVAAFLSPWEASVEVLNGTQTPGLARRTAETLTDRGMRAVRYGDAGQAASATSVDAAPGSMRAARYVASLLNLPPDGVRESLALPADVDVRVTLGGENAAP